MKEGIQTGGSTFASAEDFAHLLEEGGVYNIGYITFTPRN